MPSWKAWLQQPPFLTVVSTGKGWFPTCRCLWNNCLFIGLMPKIEAFLNFFFIIIRHLARNNIYRNSVWRRKVSEWIASDCINVCQYMHVSEWVHDNMCKWGCRYLCGWVREKEREQQSSRHCFPRLFSISHELTFSWIVIINEIGTTWYQTPHDMLHPLGQPLALSISLSLISSSFFLSPVSSLFYCISANTDVYCYFMCSLGWEETQSSSDL